MFGVEMGRNILHTYLNMYTLIRGVTQTWTIHRYIKDILHGLQVLHESYRVFQNN